MIESPEDILVVREPVERQHLVQQVLKFGIGGFALSFPHRFVDIFRDHLCGLGATDFESRGERVGESVDERLVRLLWGNLA